MAALSLWGTQFLVNTTTKYHQQNVSLHSLKGGSFVAVWEDDSRTGADTSSWAIRGQLFNTDGTKRGGEFLINTVTSGNQRDPQVTVLSDGRFVVIWEDATQDQIRARVFSAEGVALGNDFQVGTALTSGSPNPSIAALSNGGFAVAYETVDRDIVVQAFSASIERAGAEVVVNTPATGDGNDPVIVAMSGQFAVFFEEWGSEDRVHGRIFNNDGAATSASVEIPASGTDAHLYDLAAATLKGGQIVTAWVENALDPNPAEDNYIRSIKAQILNPDGSKRGSEIVIKSSVTEYLERPAITQLADGGFAVSYFVDEPDTNSKDLYLATFDSSGVRVQADMLVERTYPKSVHYSASLTTLDDGRIVVSWNDLVSDWDNNDNGIHAQIIDPRHKAISLNGTSFNDQYIGTRFNDRLKGAAGDDRLEGAEGKDTLTGNAGKDVFVFDTTLNKRTNLDKIVDFKVRDDSIWLDNAIFTKLGTSGSDASPSQLKKGFFTIGDKAKDRNDYVVYDKAKGVLYYDADGSGAGKQVEIATLSKNLSMTNKDFFVI
jgi:Ca2+-binding RTX toxin-like protein